MAQVTADASAVVYAGPFAGRGWGMEKARVSTPNEPEAGGASPTRGALQVLHPGGGHARKAAGGYTTLPPLGAGRRDGGGGALGTLRADWAQEARQEPGDGDELELQPLRLHVMGVMSEGEGSPPSTSSAHQQGTAPDGGHALGPAAPAELQGAENAAARGAGDVSAAVHGGRLALHSPFNEAEHQHWRGHDGADAPSASSAAWVSILAAVAVPRTQGIGSWHLRKLQGPIECVVAVRMRSHVLLICARRPCQGSPAPLPPVHCYQGASPIP